MTDLSIPRLSDVRAATRGTMFVRTIKALVLAKGEWVTAAAIAKSQWAQQPEIEAALKAAANAGSIGHIGSPGGWGQQLVTPTVLAEFVELVRAASVVGRLELVHRVPFNIQVGAETTAATADWVGEGSPKPAQELAYTSLTLGYAKVSVIVAISQDLARLSTPSAEDSIKSSLVKSVASFIDSQFLDPSVISSTVHPGSILAGVTPVVSSGITAAAVATDITALVDALLTASGGDLVAPILVMSPRLALRIAIKRDTSGGSAFPDMRFSGGTLMGIPVLVSAASNWSTSGGGRIVLLDQDAIMVADDGDAAVSTSMQASLQMSDAPSEGATTLTSLFQNNLVGIKAERGINWAPRRNGAATYLDGANY